MRAFTARALCIHAPGPHPLGGCEPARPIMTEPTPIKLPLPRYSGVERPIEVPFKAPLKRLAERVRTSLTVESWHWDLFKLAWPTRWQSEHLYANDNGTGTITVRFTEPDADDRHDLLRAFSDLRAAFEWFAGLGPEPDVRAPPVRPKKHDPCLLLPSNSAPATGLARKLSDGAPRREAKATPQIAWDRMAALCLDIDPDRYARECALRRVLEARAFQTSLMGM